MVMRGCVGNPETQGHHIDEGRLRHHNALRDKVIAGMEIEFINADFESVATEQRRVA